MPVEVIHEAMGHVTVITIDKYENTREYKFKPASDGLGVEPYGDGRKYTPVVLQALWEDGIVVDWSPDDLTADERAEIDGFCDDCGTAITSQQVGRDEFKQWCPECETKELVEA